MVGGASDDYGARLVVELSSVYVACDDCGHNRMLYLSNLKQATELGVQSYRDLCRKIRCGECPPRPPQSRNLTIRPTWRNDDPSGVGLEYDLVY